MVLLDPNEQSKKKVQKREFDEAFSEFMNATMTLVDTLPPVYQRTTESLILMLGDEGFEEMLKQYFTDIVLDYDPVYDNLADVANEASTKAALEAFLGKFLDVLEYGYS